MGPLHCDHEWRCFRQKSIRDWAFKSPAAQSQQRCHRWGKGNNQWRSSIISIRAFYTTTEFGHWAEPKAHGIAMTSEASEVDDVFRHIGARTSPKIANPPYRGPEARHVTKKRNDHGRGLACGTRVPLSWPAPSCCLKFFRVCSICSVVLRSGNYTTVTLDFFWSFAVDCSSVDIKLALPRHRCCRDRLVGPVRRQTGVCDVRAWFDCRATLIPPVYFVFCTLFLPSPIPLLHKMKFDSAVSGRISVVNFPFHCNRIIWLLYFCYRSHHSSAQF